MINEAQCKCVMISAKLVAISLYYLLALIATSQLIDSILGKFGGNSSHSEFGDGADGRVGFGLPPGET